MNEDHSRVLCKIMCPISDVASRSDEPMLPPGEPVRLPPERIRELFLRKWDSCFGTVPYAFLIALATLSRVGAVPAATVSLASVALSLIFCRSDRML